MTATVLAAAAFGADPGRWPLAAAATQEEWWLRAVVAGGQGRYGNAFADLDAIDRSAAPARLRSLALSTRASFLRQLGGHDRARGWDGRALAVAQGDETGEAAADALLGLAADALGVGRFAVSARLLERAEPTRPRIAVRRAWVSSELAMMQGHGSAAVAHAEQAVTAAESLGSARHSVKSQVVLSAALCSAGDVDRSRQVADAALVTAGELRLIPLRWALACLLADIGSACHERDDVIVIRDVCADTVRERGGVWSDR